MTLRSKKTTFTDFILFISFSACLWFSYKLFQSHGFNESDSKGLSVVVLVVVIALYLGVGYIWTRWGWRRRFKGLSLKEKIQEMDKVIEESITEGIITREELDEIKSKAIEDFNKKYKG